MIDYFSDRQTLVTINGSTQEYIVFKRTSRGSNTKSLNYRFQGLLQSDTSITNGDLVNDSVDYYLVTAYRQSYVSTIAELYKTNTTVDIYEIVPKFNASKQKIGDMEQLKVGSVVGYQETVSGKMYEYDLGLKSDTVRRMLVSGNTNVNLLDRIKINGENFQVNFIDKTKYEGLLEVQMCSDVRKTIV